MPYNPNLDDQIDAGPGKDLDIRAIADEDRLAALRTIREKVGDAGLSDEDMEFIAQYEMDPEMAVHDHNANLAEFMDEDDLTKIADEVIETFDWDHESRQEWYEREVRGIRMLGVTSKTDGGASFDGASKVVHPILAEACVQFQSRTIAEIWPAQGPVKTVTIGENSDEKDQQANRVGSYMNYLLNDVIPGAYEAEDMAYLRLPMSGSVFKKVYTDPIYGHMDDYVPPDEFVVPYNAVDLRTAPRYTHILFLFPNEVKRYQLTGVYRDIELRPPDERSLERVFYEEVKDSEGTTIWEREEDHRHTFLEQHVSWDLPGFEHPDMDLPYVITVDYDDRKVLSIRRNWREEDPLYVKREWFVHKKFTPGFGFYGYGFFHWIGSLTTAAIGALRALLDAAQFSTMPGGYRSKAGRELSGEGPVKPGEWRETDLQPDELDSAFFALPYKEPSNVLFMLMGHLEGLGQRFASTMDALVGEGANNVPVGTTMARIDQGMKIVSSIHKRIYRANRQEYRMLAEQIGEHMPEEGYPFAFQGVPQQIGRQDFDGRIDVLPVADPEVASSTQRIIQSQLLLEMAERAPDLYDRRAVHRRALAAVRIGDIDEILINQAQIPRRGPVEENMAMQTGKPVRARPDEDHEAHSVVHQQWFMSLPQEDQSRLMPVHTAHMAEHQAWQYHIQMSEAMGVQLPADVMQGGTEDLPPEIERELSLRAAQAVQLMPPQPSPEEMEAQAKIGSMQAEDQRKEASVQAEIARRDRLAEGEIARRDAQARADAERDQLVAEAKAAVMADETRVKGEIEQASSAEQIARTNEDSRVRREVQENESNARIDAQDRESKARVEQQEMQGELTAKQNEQRALQEQTDSGESDEAVMSKLEELSREIQELKAVEPAASQPQGPQEINIMVDAKGAVSKKIKPNYGADGRIVDLTTEEIDKSKPN